MGSRSTSGSGLIQNFAPGQEGYKYNVLFDEHSTSTTSHTFIVDNNFVRIAAFNLAEGEQVVIEQVTGQGAGDLVADYAPSFGQTFLYYTAPDDQRTSYNLERPGRYRARLVGGGLGVVHVFAIQYFVENEPSQDIVDALYAILNRHFDPCDAGANTPNAPAVNNYINKEAGGCYRDSQLVSSDAGNLIELHTDGVFVPLGAGVTPCSLGALIPNTETANNNVLSLDGDDCIVDQQLVSSLAGNLIQLQADGVYFGTNAGQFANQYVSSSTGNDSNDGLTPITPLQTINFAISRIPDATAGNILLKAGDTFHTYPTAVTDVINTLTANQSLANIIDIKNRMVTFLPYNDTPMDQIIAYNAVNGTGYDPFIAAETNFPKVNITISNPTDSPGNYIPLGFVIGLNGSIGFNATNVVMGQVGTVSPAYSRGAIVGGTFYMQGGHLIVGDTPMFGGSGFVGTQNINLFITLCEDHGVASTPPLFCAVGSQFFVNTQPASAGGGLIVPSLPWTVIADTAETFLTPAAMWPGIVIYSTPNRAFKKVITSIAIA